MRERVGGRNVENLSRGSGRSSRSGRSGRSSRVVESGRSGGKRQGRWEPKADAGFSKKGNNARSGRP